MGEVKSRMPLRFSFFAGPAAETAGATKKRSAVTPAVLPPVLFLRGSEGFGGVQKALQVASGDLGQAGCDVVQFSLAHPALQLLHQAEQVVERVHDEQEWLI